MAAAESSKALSLGDIFEQGFVLHCEIEDDDGSSTSEICQVFFFTFILSCMISVFLHTTFVWIFNFVRCGMKSWTLLKLSTGLQSK